MKIATMPEQPEQCPLCKYLALVNQHANHVQIKCQKCGTYDLSDIPLKVLTELPPQETAKISGWLRERGEETVISSELLSSLRRLNMPSVGQKADKILLFLAKTFPTPGARFDVKGDDGFEETLEAIGWTEDEQEFRFLVQRYLVEEKGFLESDGYHRLTPKGWAYLDSLRRGNPQSDIGFIAMWFSNEVEQAWTAIEQGIRSAGYSALRIDQREHNNKIDDEIIAAIRRSKFLVADFTGHRGGVYFESGFAMGLGLPVIWLCRGDHLKETHFDTRQYNFIKWEDGELNELSKKLQHRIEATIGRGPISRSA